MLVGRWPWQRSGIGVGGVEAWWWCIGGQEAQAASPQRLPDYRSPSPPDTPSTLPQDDEQSSSWKRLWHVHNIFITYYKVEQVNYANPSICYFVFVFVCICHHVTLSLSSKDVMSMSYFKFLNPLLSKNLAYIDSLKNFVFVFVFAFVLFFVCLCLGQCHQMISFQKIYGLYGLNVIQWRK